MSAERAIHESIDSLSSLLINEGFGAFAEAVVNVLQHAIDHLSDADYINNAEQNASDIRLIREARNAVDRAGKKVETL